MESFTLGELSVAVAGVLGALVMCVRQVQQSKCTEVRCCCVKCIRDVAIPARADSSYGTDVPCPDAPAGCREVPGMREP